MSQIQFPPMWNVVTLEKICSKITDGEHLKPTITSNGIPFISAKDILDDGLDFNNVSHISEKDAQRFRKKCNPEKGDILIASRGTIGKSCIVNTDKIFCLLGSV